jgi:acetyl esterase/lipase
VRFPTPLLAALLLLAAAPLHSADDYKLGADSQPKADVPHGDVRTGKFTDSKVFPGTTRDYFVYVPKQYDPAKPACLMVFFDGGGFFKADGQFSRARGFRQSHRAQRNARDDRRRRESRRVRRARARREGPQQPQF